MATTGAGTRPDVTLKLTQLQNLCKRDPQGYRSDYEAQKRRLQSECDILALSPSAHPPSHLAELIQFIAAVSSSSYEKEESDAVSRLLIRLLLGKSSQDMDNNNSTEHDTNSSLSSNISVIISLPSSALTLHRDVRKSCVSALILMRNKGRVQPLTLLELFFKFMSIIPDKGLRTQLYKHTLNDIRNINKKGKKDEQINRSIQSFLHKIVRSTVKGKHNSNMVIGDINEATKLASKKAIDLTAELYRRHVWTDDRTVAILASGVESIVHNVSSAAMRFFLGIEEKMADDEEKKGDEDWKEAQKIDYHLYSRKTKARKRSVAKAIKKKQKEQKKREDEEYELNCIDPGVIASRKLLYPAIELIRDPQGLSETVLKRIQSTGANGYKFEHKILAINFVTRLVGNHELLVLPLYPVLRRYMGGHQRDVTAILAYTVQACHETVPPEEIHGLLQTIAHNFVTERCSEEQMAVGINACRAICSRVPSSLLVDESPSASLDDTGNNASSTSMDIEAFVRDMVGYGKHRDRSVSIAGRSFTNFIREVHPSLLAGKDRGMVGSALRRAGEKPLRYGEQRIESGVQGADLLVEYEMKKALYLKQKEGRDDDEDSDSDDGISYEKMNDEDDDWIDVEEDDDGDDDSDQSESSINDELEEESGDEEFDHEGGEEDDDEIAPSLVQVEEIDGQLFPITNEIDDLKASTSTLQDTNVDLSKMTPQERSKFIQQISSTRVFTTEDFIKMRKLVDREKQSKRDPRYIARMKRLKAKGKDFIELSDDEDSVGSLDDDGVQKEKRHVKGAVTPDDIMTESKRKRANKKERLEKVLAGREAFEHKQRSGGSTNTEKTRRKNFVMSKFSFANRTKQSSKETARRGTLQKQKRNRDNKQESKKRRRKL